MPRSYRMDYETVTTKPAQGGFILLCLSKFGAAHHRVKF